MFEKKTIMHFKSAVILFTLYFVTVTQSIGLNLAQVETLVNLDTYENSINKIVIELTKEFGIDNFSDFKYDDVFNDRNKQDLMVFLASYDKNSDDWRMEPSLSSYEVRILMGLFKKFDDLYRNFTTHYGLLNIFSLVNVIYALNLDEDVKKSLISQYSKDNITLTISKFLQGFLKNKPEGRGLDANQIQYLFEFYKSHKTGGGHIDPEGIKTFFKDLSIVKDHEDLLVFESIRPAALELQELLIVYAEYNKEDNGKAGAILTTKQIRSVIWEFSTHDYDNNGLLNAAELAVFVENVSVLLAEFDVDGDQFINIAEYLIISKPFEVKAEINDIN